MNSGNSGIISIGAGFGFWGLFLVFGLIVASYIVWMFWTERK